MIRGIHHVTIHVRDLAGMAKFYCEAFGFWDIGYAGQWRDNPIADAVIGVENSAARSVLLCAGNCYLELFQYSAPQPESTTALKPHDLGYTHFCVDVTEIDLEVERLTRLGMNFDRPHGVGKAVDAGIVKSIYGKDPEGNIVEIHETVGDCIFGAEHLPRTDMARVIPSVC